MYKRLLILVALFALVASPAFADSMTYEITVNTSSIAGTTGSLDFQFNPGLLISQAANVQILNFTSNGTLVVPSFLTGDASGTLPGTVMLDNGSFFNDYFEDFTYGNTLSFDVLLGGPALISPDGTSTSDSTFAFSMFSDLDGTAPVLTSDTANGVAFLVDVKRDGTTSVTNLSSQTRVPEPSSLLLLGTGLVGLAGMARRRSSQLM